VGDRGGTTQRLEAAGVTSRVTVLNVDVRERRFENECVDATICVDAFE
jgi:hypothetical protein